MKGQRKRRGEILHLFVRLRPDARPVRCRLSGGSKAAAFDKPKPMSSVCVCIHAMYCIAGIFQGIKWNFAEKTFVDCSLVPPTVKSILHYLPPQEVLVSLSVATLS